MTNIDTTLYDLFREQAKSYAENIAFILDDRQITFAEFLQQVDQLASGLSTQGISKGDRVCILAQNSLEYLELWIASAKIGAILFPINWRLTPEEVQAVIGYADSQMLIIEAEFSGHLDDAIINPETKIVHLGGETPAGFVSFSSLFSTDNIQEYEVSPDDAAAIILTAATEGLPRGAILSHKNFAAVGDIFMSSLTISQADRSFIAFPFFHVAGLIQVLQTAILGGMSVIQSTFDPAAGAKIIDEHKITQIGTFPPMLEMLLDAKDQLGASWESLRACFGILNPPEIVQRFLESTNAEYWTGFGQSETSGIVTLFNAMEKPGSAGRVVKNLEMCIVNEDEEEVSADSPGEITAKGALIFSGYWRDEDATKYALRNGWHHTGDVGKVDEDGYLYYLGRKPEKELIKSGGENVYPAEVEYAISQIDGVEAACVFGVPDEKWGEKVKAVVVIATDSQLTSEDIIKGVAEKIASYKKPQLVEITDEIPLLENGEIDRAGVKSAFS